MLRLRQDIPLFPKGRKKALTFSYDDGITQDRRFVEMLNRYHLKGTFNLNPGLMGNKDWLSQPGIEVSHYKMDKCEIAELYKGHEIAVHTMTHPDLPRVPEGMIAYEIAACRRELEEIAKKPVTGMAYPFGTYNDKVKNAAKVCGITYSRTTKQHFSFHLPEDFLEWHPTIHHTENTLYSLWEKFLEPVDNEMYRQPQLFYVWGHTYEFDAFDQWKDMEEFLKQAGGHDEIWYATNEEIYRYVMAAQRLVYSASGDYIFNPGVLDVWMLIDKNEYHIPGGETVTIG